MGFILLRCKGMVYLAKIELRKPINLLFTNDAKVIHYDMMV